jgi:hypothetical protein
MYAIPCGFGVLLNVEYMNRSFITPYTHFLFIGSESYSIDLRWVSASAKFFDQGTRIGVPYSNEGSLI